MESPNWLSDIDQTTEDFLSLTRPLDNKQLNWKPDLGQWSIAQNMDHLIQFNESYFPILDSLKDGSYKPPLLANFGFLVSRMGNMFSKLNQPDRKKKMKTFGMWQPSDQNLSEDIIERFEKHQNELKKRIEQSSDSVERGAVISSPLTRNIVYKLDTAFDIITSHERRHLEQSKEVLEKMNLEATGFSRV